MKSALVKCYGYVGDIIFASSCAQKLKEEEGYDKVDYVIGMPQCRLLLEQNPYIDQVIITGIHPSPVYDGSGIYDKEFQLGPLSLMVPPPMEMQRVCGIQNPTSEYTVYTVPEMDERAESWIRQHTDKGDGTVLAVMEPQSWQEKAFVFTEEEYRRGENVPYLGYGGRLRNITSIIQRIGEEYQMIQAGYPPTNNSMEIARTDHDAGARRLAWEASLMKQCKAFIGTEGGLANLAAGLGVPTILTGEYVHQLYGWNGVIRQVEAPQLGPHLYFPGQNHSMLNPFLTDDGVVDQMLTLLRELE